MNKYIKYLKSLLYIFIPILILNIILSVSYYFNIIGDKALNILTLIITGISMLIGGFYIGKHSNEKGYISGLKLGIITVFLLFIITYLGYSKGITISRIVYYLILIAGSILGSMIGINKKRTN